jgi:hypothetical protein
MDSEHKGKVSFIVTVKNFGNSVALGTAVDARAITAWSEMRLASDSACANSLQMSRLSNYRAFAINQFPLPRMTSGVMFPSETTGRHFANAEVKGGEIPITLMIVGCISYQDQFGKQRRTRFCYGGGENLGKYEATTAPVLIYQCQMGPTMPIRRRYCDGA